MKIIVALLALALSGCGLFRHEVQIIKVPVEIACLKDVPDRPEYLFPVVKAPETPPEAALAAKALAKDFEAADLYGRQWEAAAAGCIVLRAP